MAIGDVDFALVPALAVDREGYRLGYGAGYFDRLLAGSPPTQLRVVALPDALFVERLPREAHDVAVDAVMTETQCTGSGVRAAMSARNIDGKSIAAQFRAECAIRVERLKEEGVIPGLAVVIVGDDAASKVYVRNKALACEAIGMHSEVHALLRGHLQAQLVEFVHSLNDDPDDPRHPGAASAARAHRLRAR